MSVAVREVAEEDPSVNVPPTTRAEVEGVIDKLLIGLQRVAARAVSNEGSRDPFRDTRRVSAMPQSALLRPTND